MDLVTIYCLNKYLRTIELMKDLTWWGSSKDTSLRYAWSNRLVISFFFINFGLKCSVTYDFSIFQKASGRIPFPVYARHFNFCINIFYPMTLFWIVCHSPSVSLSLSFFLLQNSYRSYYTYLCISICIANPVHSYNLLRNYKVSSL